MSAKKTAHMSHRELGGEDRDKENRSLYANLKFNNIDKDLEDAHLFKMSKKNLAHDRDRSSDKERPSKTTMSRSCKQLPTNQTETLMELLREEIEKKYSESTTNKQYKFPRRARDAWDSEDSLHSLEDIDTYNLFGQNRVEKSGAQEVESLLSRLVTLVNKTPECGAMITQKHTNSHRLFCQLLKNVASDKDNGEILKQKSLRHQAPKKSREKTTLTTQHSQKSKIGNILAKSGTSQLIGKIHLKTKGELLAGIKASNRSDHHAPLLIEKLETMTSSTSKGLRELVKVTINRDLARSGSGKLLEPNRITKPLKKRTTNGSVKKITTVSFGSSGIKGDKSASSRRQSPEEQPSSSRLNMPQFTSSGMRSLANFSKKLAANTKVKAPQVAHFL